MLILQETRVLCP